MADSKTWTWSRYGVTLEEDHLLWFEELGPVAFASGGASEQTFAHFLANGPWVEHVPEDVVEELTKAVKERTAAQSGASNDESR